MQELTPYEEKLLLWHALVEVLGAVKAKELLDRQKYEYAMIKNSSNIEVR